MTQQEMEKKIEELTKEVQDLKRIINNISRTNSDSYGSLKKLIKELQEEFDKYVNDHP